MNKNLRNAAAVLFLFAGMLFAGVTMVTADEGSTAVTEAKKKPCYDYDRPSGDRSQVDETQIRPAGDCPGNVPTPEPVSILLFSAGLAGVGFVARRRLRKSEQ